MVSPWQGLMDRDDQSSHAVRAAPPARQRNRSSLDDWEVPAPMTLMLTWPLLGRANWSEAAPCDALGASGAPRLHDANAAAAAQTTTVLQTDFMGSSSQ